MTDMLTDALISAFQDAGIPACSEFPQIGLQMSAAPFFVTFAVIRAECSEPLLSLCGDALAVSLTLRIRCHCRTDADWDQYGSRAAQCLADTLQTLQYDIRKITRGELRYLKQLDRLERETTLELSGILYLQEENLT